MAMQPDASNSNTETTVESSEWSPELAFDPERQEEAQQKWQQIRCYGFRAGNINLLAPLNVYCELLTNIHPEPVPNAPKHFLGLCNVRGNLVPVYQLEPLMEMSPPMRKYALVIGKLDRAGALVIGAKPKPFDFREFEVTENPEAIPELLQDCILEHYAGTDGQWHLLDHAVLFNRLANTHI